MAQQDFEINIRTTADLAGVRRLETELSSLKARVATEGGGAEGVGGGAEAVATRAEHGLVRYAAHAIGIGLILEEVAALKKAGEEIEKDSVLLAKQGEQLQKNAMLYGEQAKAATNQTDILKVAEGTMKDIEKAHKTFVDMSQKELGYAAKFSDYLNVQLFQNRGKLTGDYEAARLAKLKNAQDEEAYARSNAFFDIQKAKTAEAKRDAQSFDETLKELNNTIKNREDLAERALFKGEIEEYIRLSKEAETYKKELIDVLKLEEAREKAVVAAAKPLGAALAKPTGEFIGEQISAAQQHERDRAALEQKRREAVATGNKEEAAAITENLKHDRFGRDQRKEQLQRYVADQESLFRVPGEGVADRLKDIGPLGEQKYQAAVRELEQIYAKEKGERREMGAGTATSDAQRIVEAINNLAALWK